MANLCYCTLYVYQVFYLLFTRETENVSKDEMFEVFFCLFSLVFFGVVPSVFFLKQFLQNSSNIHTGTRRVHGVITNQNQPTSTSSPTCKYETRINHIFHALAFHKPTFTFTLCSPFSKRDNISESLLSECTSYTVQQRCCSSPMIYSFSICSCILNSLKVAHSDWRKERKSLLLEKLVFDSCTGETTGAFDYDVTCIHGGVVAKKQNKITLNSLYYSKIVYPLWRVQGRAISRIRREAWISCWKARITSERPKLARCANFASNSKINDAVGGHAKLVIHRRVYGFRWAILQTDILHKYFL